MNRCALLPLCFLLGCGPASETADPVAEEGSAITSPTTDADRGDSEVVALIVRGAVNCSGTLIAPRVVLTAAHCLADVRPESVFFGTDPATAGGTSVGVSTTYIAADFNPSTLANDIGVVLLSSAATAAPARLQTEPLPALSAQTVRVVGFGITGVGTGAGTHKRSGISTVSKVGVDTLALAPSPSQPCHGDSGGPIFATIDGEERLVGVTSNGDPQCATFTNVTRIDRYLAFVQPLLADTAAPVSSGGCAVAGEHEPGGEGLPWGLFLAVALYASIRPRCGGVAEKARAHELAPPCDG